MTVSAVRAERNEENDKKGKADQWRTVVNDDNDQEHKVDDRMKDSSPQFWGDKLLRSEWLIQSKVSRTDDEGWLKKDWDNENVSTTEDEKSDPIETVSYTFPLPEDMMWMSKMIAILKNNSGDISVRVGSQEKKVSPQGLKLLKELLWGV
jgi:hypothetical protein